MTSIKELINEVERLKETKRKNRGGTISNFCRIKLKGIKQAIDDKKNFDVKDWNKLKRTLDI